MFEDLKPQHNKNSKSKVQSSNLNEVFKESPEKNKSPAIEQQKKPEDIFAETENKNRPFLKGVDKKKKNEKISENRDNSNRKKFIFIGISLGAIIIFVSFFLLMYKIDTFNFSGILSFEKDENNETEDTADTADTKENQETDESLQTEDNENEEIAAPNIEETANKNFESAPIYSADTDGDGLSDEEEQKLGTNKNKIDTDEDNLSDREELMVYKTDPLNPDSDSDGYLDGDEVSAGYNPKGAGKLMKNSPNF